jgi:hypothetical protein
MVRRIQYIHALLKDVLEMGITINHHYISNILWRGIVLFEQFDWLLVQLWKSILCMRFSIAPLNP